MEIPLGSWPRRAAAVASFAIAAVVIWQASTLWLARHRLSSENLATMIRGASLTPGDGAAWDHIGQSEFLNSDVPEAIAHYREAVAADSLSPHYWVDLAAAYEAAGDNGRAQDGYAHAAAASPLSAEVAFSYGSFLLREEHFPEAYKEFRRATLANPELLPLAISRTWRATGDVDQINQMLPVSTDAYLQAIDFFASNHKTEPALRVWQRLIGLGTPIDLPSAFPFLDELIREDRADDARSVWAEALVAAGLPPAEPFRHSLIWNGDFKQKVANGGLDWRWSPVLGVAIGFDSQPSPEGSRPVRLDFSGGSNVNLTAPFEFVPVQPSASYHFHAYMRTEDITTESGLRFAIFDPNHANVVSVLTDDFTGTHAWTAIDADLTTGPETRFLVVQVTRSPSRLFDNKLGGTGWIADISLVPSRAETDRASQ
jgi:tetratricopeptide (TPR) repeat protein